MGGFFLRLRNWWLAADRTQKLITVFGGGSLIVLLIATYIYASRPKMSLVFSNLSPEDTGSVSMEIENMGIACTFDSNGNVQVPSDKVARVKATLAMNGKLPKGSGHFGSEELDHMPLMTSPPVEKEKIKDIIEGDLSQSIQFFDGVDTANVKISLGVDSPFEAEKKPAQANVTVGEKSGSTISQDEAKAMANLVSSAIPGLDKSKVTIFTRTGRALWDGQDMADGNSNATNRLDLEKQEARQRRDKLQEALNRALGPGNAIAMVDLSLDMTTPEKVVEKHDPSSKPTSEKKITEGLDSQTAGTIGGASGAAGNDPNNRQPVISGDGGKSTYKVDQSAKDFGDHYERTITKKVGGDIQSMSVTVLVNKTDKVAVDPSNPKDPIVVLANSAIPPHDPAMAANFPAASVVAYPFDTTQADAAKKAEESGASSNKMQQILSILPIGVLILVAFMVIRAIGKLAGRPMTPALAGAGGPSLGMSGGGQMFASLEAPAKALESANRFVLPEIVKQKAMEAGISEEQLQAAIEEAGESGISVDDIPHIKNKVNVPLEQIKKMAHDRPETVAMLIKSWLIEEGIRR